MTNRPPREGARWGTDPQPEQPTAVPEPELVFDDAYYFSVPAFPEILDSFLLADNQIMYMKDDVMGAEHALFMVVHALRKNIAIDKGKNWTGSAKALSLFAAAIEHITAVNNRSQPVLPMPEQGVIQLFQQGNYEDHLQKSRYEVQITSRKFPPDYFDLKNFEFLQIRQTTQPKNPEPREKDWLDWALYAAFIFLGIALIRRFLL